MEQCEFCGRNVKNTRATTFLGSYCIACHRLVISESQEAIREMKGLPPKPLSKAPIKEQEKEANKQFAKG